MGLLDRFKDPETLKSEQREEALEQAILSNDVDTARRLIDEDPKWLADKADKRVLREPVIRGHFEMYKLLREKGVDFGYSAMNVGRMVYTEADKYIALERNMASSLRIETLEQQVAEMKRDIEALRPKTPTQAPPPAPAGKLNP